MTVSIGQVVGTERDEATIRADVVNVALAQAFQIEIPGILKSHARKAKDVRPGAREKSIPTAKAGLRRSDLRRNNLRRNGQQFNIGFRRGPMLRDKLAFLR